MSFRSQFDSPAIDSAGNALADIEVTVYESDGVTEATIFAGRTGGSTVANPITTGATGLVQFWANPGTYVIAFHDTELPARISDRQLYWEAVSGDDDSGGIGLAQLTRGTGGYVLKTPSGASGQAPEWGTVESVLSEKYSNIFSAKGTICLDAASGTYLLGSDNSGIMGRSAVTDSEMPPEIFRLVGNDLKRGTKTPWLRLYSIVATNATAPAINFTFGLNIITSAGAADTQIFTAAAPVGSTAAINTPSSSTVTSAASSLFAMPSDGNYCLTVVASGIIANNSHVSCHSYLQVINV